MDEQSWLSGLGSSWLDCLSAAVSLAFILVIPMRLWELQGEPDVVRRTVVARMKQFITVLCALAQLATLAMVVLASPRDPQVTTIYYSAAAFNFICAVGIGILSFFEHMRSIKPSDTIVLFLVASLVVDWLHLWLSLADAALEDLAKRATTRGVFYGSLCKLMLLISESRGKQNILLKTENTLAPEESAGIIQRTFLWWVNPILHRGASGTLRSNDLQVTDAKLSSRNARYSINRLWDGRARPENMMTLPLVLLKCLGNDFFWAVPSRVFLILFQYGPPLLMKETIRYLSQPWDAQRLSTRTTRILAFAVIVYIGQAISSVVYQHQQDRLRAKTRGALVGLVYHKTLRSRSNGHDLGKAVTLINTDVDSLVTIARFAHDVWGYVLELVIGMFFLASQVGWLSPVPLVIILFCSRVSKYVAQNIRGRQKDWNTATQNRLSMISTFLGSIKTIKSLGVSGAMANLITSLRSAEIESAKRVRWVMIAYNASANALGIFSPAITMILYGIVSHRHHVNIDPETAFTTIAVLSMVIHPANMIMTIVPNIVACFASFDRIQSYLLEPPRHDQRIDTVDDNDGEINLENVSVQADKTSRPALDAVSLRLERSSIVACTGPTGAGKTILAKAMLGEVHVSQGTVKLRSRRIGYCDQTPWLPNGSIRDVIVNFASHVDETRYWSSLNATCLVPDLRQLPMGDGTEIGSRGLNLSGGQRQRVALARMLYDACDVVILDDPFSASDGQTEDQVIQNLLGPEGIFRTRKTTVLWITNATHYFGLPDSVVVLEKCRIKEHGKWSELTSFPAASRKVMPENLKASSASETQAMLMEAGKKRAKEIDTRLDVGRKTGNVRIYSYYLRSVGIFSSCFMMGCTATYSFFITFPHYWLKRWTEADPKIEWMYALGYGLLALFAWIATNGTMWSTYMLVSPRSGRRLHSRLLSNVIGAPLSFFAITDAGVILNRFSQDIQLVDKDLPAAFQSLSNQTFKILVQIIVLLAVQKLLLWSIPICLVIVYIIAKVYLRMSRRVQIEELASRSAVISQITETVEGLITIRAFGWQGHCQSNLDHALDVSQGPLYLLSCLRRWLTLVLDLMLAAISIGIIALALFGRGATDGAGIGVALNVIIVTNATLLRLVESWATFEISLGAIDRLKTLDDEIQHEDQPWEDVVPDVSWPQRGDVVLHKLTASYNQNAVALRNISLDIKSGQKVVICGRTGSGKSSVLLSLLRLIDTTGNVSVDGIDLSSVSRATIRERCFITVPQDPMILPDASLRISLDPSGEADDMKLIDALKRTGVWEPLFGPQLATPTDILDRKVCELPTLSTGQTQLLGLARALTKKAILGSQCKPVLLLDEATSSLDTKTESLIHEVIDEEFCQQGHTVIAVSHRLSIVASQTRSTDMVVTMADGVIQKVGRTDEVLGLDHHPTPSIESSL
ncbi:hypothetical protein RJ55_02732 [Drechmeria coniospora]|nr:hypothetical protein RJ55_02732 [Drechmeria coniospora]